jgi:protein-disulfide isomerase
VGKAKRIRAARVPTPPKSKKGQSSLLTQNRVLAVVGIAALIAVALVVASVLSTRGGDEGAVSEQVTGGADVQALLEGIPQTATVIGEDDAPVTLVEYADLQCPFCAQWSASTFPELVADYVRDGRLRIEFRGMAFIGPESEDALRAALAAGEQGKLWNVVDLIYMNQGPENGGWVTDDFLQAVGMAVPGLDVDRMMDERDSAAVSSAVDETAVAASSAGITSTPTFLVGETGGELSPLEVSSLEPEEFRAAIDELLEPEPR